MTASRPTVAEISRLLGAEFQGADVDVTGVAPLDNAGVAQLTFVVDPIKSAAALEAALAAGAVVLHPSDTAVTAPRSGVLVLVANPRGAFAEVVRSYFAPTPSPGVHPTALVDPSAQIDSSASIGAFTVVGPRCIIGEEVEIRHHVVLGPDVVIGPGSMIKSHAVIGEEGLGIDADAEGNNVRLPHIGGVVLEERVEVGSFSTVCAGTIVPTRVGAHSKIDDHAHLAHNVQLGRNVIVVANAELAGSVHVGDRAWIGPNASVLNGISVGAGATVGIGAVVTRAVPDGETWFGNPARTVPQPPPSQ